VSAVDGRVLWKTPIPDEPGTPYLGGVSRTGALTAELFIVASSNSRVYGIDRATGAVRWSHRGQSPYEAGVAVLGGVAVAAGLNGEIVGLDVATGVLRWRASTGGSSVTKQITTDGRCAYVTVSAVLCVDSKGVIRWDHGSEGRGGPDYFSPARAFGDRLFIGSSSGFHALQVPR